MYYMRILLLVLLAVPLAVAIPDLTGDNTVGIGDLLFVLERLGTNDFDADVNRDGIVDLLDLVLVARAYGQSAESEGVVFANEPSGWTVRLYETFDGREIHMHDDRWWTVGPWGGVNDVFHGGYASIVENPAGAGQFQTLIRTFIPEGYPGGHDPARYGMGISDAGAGGYYLSYSFRLSDGWETQLQGSMGPKQAIPWIEGGDVLELLRLGTLGWIHPPGLGSFEFGFSYLGTLGFEGQPERGPVPFVNSSAALFGIEEFVQVEQLVLFNTAGPNSASVQIWMNGELTHNHQGIHLPAEHIRLVTFPMTYGGGIGDASADKWHDLAYVYVSTP